MVCSPSSIRQGPANKFTAVFFGLVLKFGNLALVLMDTAFWQKSFASEVESVVPAYDLVSVVILAVPWCTGTIIGLSGRAIEKTPVWFDYPNLLTEKQVNSGLVMPYVLRSLLGEGATTGVSGRHKFSEMTRCTSTIFFSLQNSADCTSSFSF